MSSVFDFFMNNKKHVGGAILGMTSVSCLMFGAGMLLNHYGSLVDEGTVPGEIAGWSLVGAGVGTGVLAIVAEIIGQCIKCNSGDQGFGEGEPLLGHRVSIA